MKTVFGYVALGWIMLYGTTFGEVALPSIISDHMVLRKADGVPIWGKSDPGENISVKFADQVVETVAGTDGKWMVKLNLQHSAQGPFELKVEGKNKIVVKDVVVGEVWMAAGQSNMELYLSRTKGAEEEIAQSDHPFIRQFIETLVETPDIQDDCIGHWIVCNPKESGTFTAAGYYFAKELQSELNTPIGLINTAWGGSAIESWISHEGYEQDAELKEARDRNLKGYTEHVARTNAYKETFAQWLKNAGRTDKPTPDLDSYIGDKINPNDWKPVEIPLKIFAGEWPQSGVVWVRAKVNLSREISQGTVLRIGNVDAFPSVYVNGISLAKFTFKGGGRGYDCYIGPNSGKEGENTIAVRFYAPYGNNGGISMRVDLVEISRPVLAKVEYALPAADDTVKSSVPKPPIDHWYKNPPSYKYNGMIAPICSYGISGVIWYQGEANKDYAVQYRRLFPMLIEDWREKWKQPDLPFYFCQLPNVDGPKKNMPQESAWAELREAQAMALKLPHTGMATLIDVGEGDVHPRNKKDPGLRLAQIALAKTYGKDIPYSGPMYESMQIIGNKIKIQFAPSDTPLVAKPLPSTYEMRSLTHEIAPLVRNTPNSEVEGFAICGEDHKWVWANATIDKNSVMVWSDDVPQPIAVRYAWANNPICNLYNNANLPAPPFRTDAFPEITAAKKY